MSLVSPMRWLAAMMLCTAVPVTFGQTAADPGATRPVVVELFTSQSCSSCPPAEAYVGTLTQRSDVLALSFHVDYWNHLGWVDRLSSPVFTDRQRDYARLLGTSVYTPQIVVDGQADTIGSDRGSTEAAIRKARARQAGVKAAITVVGGRVDLTVESTGSGDGPAGLLLLTFDPQATDAIASGENAGRTVRQSNVVRSLRRVAEWQRDPIHVSETLLPAEKGQRVALLVQNRRGQIIGAAVAPL